MTQGQIQEKEQMLCSDNFHRIFQERYAASGQRWGEKHIIYNQMEREFIEIHGKRYCPGYGAFRVQLHTRKKRQELI